MIQENPDGEFAVIYAEQESGTIIKNREEMNRMLKDCERGKINLILTKSLSRFGRNIVDTLITLYPLAEKNISTIALPHSFMLNLNLPTMFLRLLQVTITL